MASRRKKQPKDVPYPKKFRQTLEKMAAARDERATFAKLDALVDAATTTLAKEFFAAPYHKVHGVGDEDRMRLKLHYQVDPPLQTERVYVAPPWETEIPPA